MGSNLLSVPVHDNDLYPKEEIMTQESDYVIIDYMYRNAQNTKSYPTYPMIFDNPNGYPMENVRAKLRELGVYPETAIIFQHTFEGLIKYEKLTNEDFDSYDWRDGGYEHPFTEVRAISSLFTVRESPEIDVQTLIAEYISAHNQPIPTIEQLFEKLEKDGVHKA